MPQEKYRISPQGKFNLLRSLDHVLGLFVKTKTDCSILSNVLLSAGYDYLSESTLYRLLVKPHSQHVPNLHTLNTLAQFCQFKDWFDFEWFSGNYFQYACQNGHTYGLNEHTVALLRTCIYRKNFRAVAEFFDQDFSIYDDFFMDRILGFEIYRIMLHSPVDNSDFYRSFYRHPVLRRILFEHNTDPDCKLKNHALGMELYLSASEPDTGADGLRDFIFAHCLLLRYYFRLGNYPKVLELGKTLYECEDFDVESVQFYPRFRYHACRLLYFKAQDNISLCRDHEGYLLWYFKRHAHKLKAGDLFPSPFRQERFQNQATAALSIFGDAMMLAQTPKAVQEKLVEMAYQPDNPLFTTYASRGLHKLLPSLEINIPYVYHNI